MSLFEWNETYSVGINKLDEQHRNLVTMINDLYDAMRIGQGKILIQQILDKMTHYTVTHFESEETLFDKYNYPDTEKHKKEHKEFVNTVLDFKEKYDKGSILLSVKLLNFLRDWLLNHIQGSDKDYGPFLQSKGEK